MKVLHICNSDLEGGAARAAYRIHQAQRKNGVDSHMLVVNKISDDPYVHTVKTFTKFRIKIAELLAHKILKFQKSSNLVHHSLNIFPSGLLKNINSIAPDVVNLHWLGGEMLSIKEISKIEQPIVWSMHDMWAFCGAEHYEDPMHIDRYQQAYNKNNRCLSDSGLDLNKFIYNQKKKHWKNKTFNIVTPSTWLADCSRKSALLGKHPIAVISNCIDHSIYRPINKNTARKLLGLPLNKKLLLFGAMSSTSDPRKGYHLLKSSLLQLQREGNAQNVELVVFGASRGKTESDTGIVTHYMGRLYDDITLVLLYNAADIFVAPSLQDNLPNTLVESLACGTSCVAFNLGGMPDLICDERLGSLAVIKDSEGLKNAIEHHLSQHDISKDTISKVSSDLRSEDIISSFYHKLYLELVKI
jgi:glycosyltransferase involved in cell wall biosynthesis